MIALNPTTSQRMEQGERQFNKIGRFAGKFFLALGRMLAWILIILLGLPVILLPLSTPVPAWIWIPLGLADMALIILLFRVSPAWRGMLVNLVGVALVSLAAVVISQVFATTPPITDAHGNVLR